jgi:ketosteroid isomerase-like protein
MLRFHLMALLALFVVVGGVLAADDKTAEEVKKLERVWAKAYVKRDVAFLEKHVPDDFTFTHADGSTTDKKAELGAVKSGVIALTELKIGKMKARVYGDTVVLTGHSIVKGKVGGKDVDGDYAFTDVWVKRDGRWQMVAAQVTRVAKP